MSEITDTDTDIGGI